MAPPLVIVSWSEAERPGLKAKTEAGTLSWEGLLQSGSGMEAVFSLSVLEL